MVILMILTQLLLIPVFTAESKADTRVTITVSVGGIACGVYIFLHLLYRSSMTIEPYHCDTALFNHDTEGWKVGFPTIKQIQSEYNKQLFQQNIPETVQIELLKIRF